MKLSKKELKIALTAYLEPLCMTSVIIDIHKALTVVNPDLKNCDLPSQEEIVGVINEITGHIKFVDIWVLGYDADTRKPKYAVYIYDPA